MHIKFYWIRYKNIIYIIILSLFSKVISFYNNIWNFITLMHFRDYHLTIKWMHINIKACQCSYNNMRFITCTVQKCWIDNSDDFVRQIAIYQHFQEINKLFFSSQMYIIFSPWENHKRKLCIFNRNVFFLQLHIYIFYCYKCPYTIFWVTNEMFSIMFFV